MDPMDYAFNHPSSSVAPYHLDATSLSPAWISYATGPDTDTGGGPFYVLPPALPTSSAQNLPTQAHSRPNNRAQSLWSSTVLQHDSSLQDRMSSRLRPVSMDSASSLAPSLPISPAGELADSAIWRSPHGRHLPSMEHLDSSSTQHPQALNDSPQVDGRICFNGNENFNSQTEHLRLQHSHTNGRSADPGQRGIIPELGWRSVDSSESQNGLLSSLRSQPYFRNGRVATSRSLLSAPQVPHLSSMSESRTARSTHTEQANQSVMGTNGAVAGPARGNDCRSPPSLSTTSSLSRSGGQSPSTRTSRATRHSHDAQRPSLTPIDVSSSISLATNSSDSATAAVAPSSRRPRASRPGARRPVTSPRPPQHSHHRNQIDRSMIQEFLASQNIGPSDQITGQPYTMIEEILYRNLYAMQTTMNQGRIARKSMVKSLASVPIDDLPWDERACTICYGDYGVESPEGTIEEALQLPDCKHIFGSCCLRTWLADSDRCPYCRRKLPSEPRWFQSSAKRVLEVLRRPTNPSLASGSDSEACLAIVRGYSRGAWLERDSASNSHDPPSTSSREQNTEGSQERLQGQDIAAHATQVSSERQRRLATSMRVESIIHRGGLRQDDPMFAPLLDLLAGEQSSDGTRLS